MRLPWPFLLILLSVFAPPVAAQAPEATIEPAMFFFDDDSTSLAHFRVHVRNDAGQPDAFTLSEVQVEPAIGNRLRAFYSPVPTLPLEPGRNGTFNVWIAGFEQPPPVGPAAGEYDVRIRLSSTVEPQRHTLLQATIRRTVPPVPPTGVIEGTVHDSRTGQVPTPFGPVDVAAHSADHVRQLDAAASNMRLGEDGKFRLELPEGRYWLRAEASGYQTAYAGPLEVTPNATVGINLAMSPDAFGRFESVQPRIGRSSGATYELATSLDMTSVATVPGAYERAANPAPENVFLFTADATARWARPLPTATSLPIEHPSWSAMDNAVDVTQDGQSVAVGTVGGTVQVYAADGKERWQQPYRGEGDVNPLVPGPFGRGVLRSNEVRFSHDGQRLAAGSLTGWVYLFDVNNASLLWKTPTRGEVRSIRFSPDDERVYAASGDNRVYALEAASGTVRWQAAVPDGLVDHLGLARDPTRVFLGGRDGSLRMIDDTGRIAWSQQVPGPILGADVAPTGQQAVAMTPYGVYSFTGGGALRWFRGETDNHGELRMGSSGRYLSYGKAPDAGGEPLMRVLRNDGTLSWEYESTQAEAIHNVYVREDGSRIVANGRSGNVYFFDHWARPPTGTRGPPDPDGRNGGGGSPHPGLVPALLILAWVAWRRREA